VSTVYILNDLKLFYVCICIIICFIILASGEVDKFLQSNPNVLENYVMENVSREQLERWLIRKSKSNKTDSKNRNGQGLL